MILEVDLGNTRCKWRLLGSGAPVCGVVETASLRRGVPPETWPAFPVTRVRAANVAGVEAAEGLANVVKALGWGRVEFARVERLCAGVTCGYRDLSRLGVDRWLAVLGAHRHFARPCLVADCGSAVTLDLLGAGGRHLGGYIVPGLALMRRALFRDTDAVKVPDTVEPGMSLVAGRDTDEAVNRGLVLMVLGAIEEAMKTLAAEAPSPLLVVTGGDGPILASLAEHATELVPDLVLDGLALSNP
ncbi:Type III pantothenate kinase [Microbulbifer aggregans]|uniref:Type III pantothenate kinase n=1 Tax=Microbulbifer aggregans TaxID=1769779 RepID=A0A1C9W6Q0_9GAMM|nr:type III pantothenate kinase [Microbulbifer aggregans]AOS96810.1 Type III pantothenate kinase [Microbulbifer aggregans]